MFWQETTLKKISDNDTVLLSFKIIIDSLLVDNIVGLSRLILKKVPYLQDEKSAGIHNIHGAESGNGWQRDDTNDAIFYPSRRNRLVLQLPLHIAKKVKQDLENFNDKLLGKNLVLSEPKINSLVKCGTILARYVVSNRIDELKFLADVANNLQTLNIQVKKMLCGKSHFINTDEGVLLTRSLLLADLDVSDALVLQASGIGNFKLLGCGLFLPHKSVEDVYNKT